MTLVYIAIGSNLASPLEQVNAAVNALADIPDSRVISVSSFYRTPPLGPQDQPDYLNVAVALETALTAEALLNHTQRIELHYDMKNRGFMLWPLFEIAPELRFPDGTALRAVLANLGAEKPALW